MFCQNCGKEIKENSKFCIHCGQEQKTKIEPKELKRNCKKIVLIVIIFILALASIGGIYYVCNNKINKNSANIVQKRTAKEILAEINELQEYYFKIIKNNHILLQINTSDEKFEQDFLELDDLTRGFTERFDDNNEFLRRYQEISANFSENTGETTYEMIEFEAEHYKAIDKLLNDVYKELKTKLSQEDFEQLKLSQRAWLKEVLDYEKIYKEQEFGSIGPIIKYGYEIDMRSFRILLLLLYFEII